jgi:hypothetical protein
MKSVTTNLLRLLVSAALPISAVACSLSATEPAESEESAMAVADASTDVKPADARNDVTDGCADSGTDTDAGACSGESGALCIVPFGTHAGEQGRYNIFTHECHFAADKCKSDNPTRTVGIVACRPANTTSCNDITNLEGHTMNWYVDGDKICIVEPQLPSSKCCFPAQKNCDGTLVLPPDVAHGEGAKCMAKMCGSQYLDASAGDAASCCLPQDAGIHVPSVDDCAKKNPSDPDTCQYCCHQTADHWDSVNVYACQAEDKANYENDCNAMCNSLVH